MPRSLCRVTGCRRKPHAHGLCQKHYDQQRKHAAGKAAAKPARAAKSAAGPAGAPPLDALDGKFCHVPGCTSPHHARGYCKSHYGQVRRHGKIEAPPAQAGGEPQAPLSKERRLLEIVKRHEILKKEIASIHKELEAQVDED